MAFSFIAALAFSGYLLSTFALFRSERAMAFKSLLVGIWLVMFAFSIYTTFVGNVAALSDAPFAKTISEAFAYVSEMQAMQFALVIITTLFCVICLLVASYFLSAADCEEGPMARVFGVLVACEIAYFALGGFWTEAFPETIEVSRVPKPGEVVMSRDGVEIKVDASENDGVRLRFTLEPGAALPLMFHGSIDKTVDVVEGALTILRCDDANRKIKKDAIEGDVLKPGESTRIGKGTIDGFKNATDLRAAFTTSLPVATAAQLSEVTSVIFNRSRSPLGGFFLQSVVCPRYDCWPGTQSPEIQRVIAHVLGPTARLLGYSAKFADHPPIDTVVRLGK